MLADRTGSKVVESSSGVSMKNNGISQLDRKYDMRENSSINYITDKVAEAEKKIG